MVADSYHLDLKQFSLEKFHHILETEDALPSRKVLKEQIPERFTILENMGIKNLHDLIQALKELSQQTGVPEDALLELVKLSNLARAGWVGPIFARLLYEAGATSIKEYRKVLYTPDKPH